MEKKLTLLGQEVNCKDRAQYRDKLDAAEEYVAMASVFNEEVGVAYMTHLEKPVEVYYTLKLYTDADLSEYEGIDGLVTIMDKLEYEAYDELCEFAQKDLEVFRDMVFKLFYNACEIFEKTNSLEHNVKTSFKFLFDGKDITETMAQAREINEQMIDSLGAMAKQKTIDFSQYAKKNGK